MASLEHLQRLSGVNVPAGSGGLIESRADGYFLTDIRFSRTAMAYL